MLKKITTQAAIAVLSLLIGGGMAFAQTTITIDGDMSDWTEEMKLDVPPNNPIITWHEGADGRDNSPADPDDLSYLVDLNFSDLYATDDEDYLYIRIDMNERADVRNIVEDTAQYTNAYLSLYLSTDPDLFADFRDTTGMTWGWYANGIDFTVPLFPIDEAYYDSTGFHVPISEHTQEGNGFSFEIYQRMPELGAMIAWNEDHNKVEIAIPKSVILQPVNLPEEVHENNFVSIVLMSGAVNEVQDNPWWSQRIANTLDIDGFIYTYEADWSGTDPLVPTSADEQVVDVPASLQLYQNYPNPFNPTTNIRFAVPESQNVQVNVYDMLGRHVSTVMDRHVSAGAHTVAFDGAGLSSGIYLYTVTAGSQTLTGKMLLVK